MTERTVDALWFIEESWSQVETFAEPHPPTAGTTIGGSYDPGAAIGGASAAGATLGGTWTSGATIGGDVDS